MTTSQQKYNQSLNLFIEQNELRVKFNRELISKKQHDYNFIIKQWQKRKRKQRS